MNALQLLLTVFTQRNFVADFLQAKYDFTPKTAALRFRAPFGELGATYDHLRLIEKRVVDVLLVFTELFLLGLKAEVLQANIGSKSAISLQCRPVVPKFQVEGVAPTNHSSSQKSRQNFLSYGIKIWTDFSSVLSQCTTLHMFDGQTDRQAAFSSLDHVCIPCSAVKTVFHLKSFTETFMKSSKIT